MGEQVLIWAKIVEVQRIQSTIITRLSETKEFDKINTIKGPQRHNLKKTSNMCINAHEAELQFLWFQPSTQTMPSLWEEVCGVLQGQPL